MSVGQNKVVGMNPSLAGDARRRQSRRSLFAASLPLVVVIAGMLAACGKKGDLEAPLRAAPAAPAATPADEQPTDEKTEAPE